MKLCLAQINTTPGDFEGNLARIKTGVATAARGNCDLVVFPELTVPGYLSQDLIYNPDFIDRNLGVINEVTALTARYPGLFVVLGYIDRNAGTGKPFRNMATVMEAGRVVCSYQKQLLPFYDVFDELRYFEPGTEAVTFEAAGRNIGLAICEDLWNDKGTDDYNYVNNPLEQYRSAGVDLLLSLNSSPYVQGKCNQRLEMIVPATRGGMAVAYVNQVGGQDELVFDGQSFFASNGELKTLSNTLFEDSYDMVDLEQGRAIPLDEVEAVSLTELLTLGLRDYVRKSGFEQLVLASSGGVDSAVVCKLACDAVGPENVHAIRMPSVFSSDHSRDDAIELHKRLGCWDYEVPVEHEPIVEELNALYGVHADEKNLVSSRIKSGTYFAVADENIQARLRDVYVMHFSNAYGAMPLSTGNKTEAGCGYYTHFDMNFSYAPIKDLYKFQVVEIAQSVPVIPENIWQKPPSAELNYGQTDEDSLLPYSILDPIVMSYVEDYVTTFARFRQWVAASGKQVTSDPATLSQWVAGEQAEPEYQRIISLIGKMEYKRRQTCPGTKVSKVAFGIGRRIPIVEKWS